MRVVPPSVRVAALRLTTKYERTYGAHTYTTPVCKPRSYDVVPVHRRYPLLKLKCIGTLRTVYLDFSPNNRLFDFEIERLYDAQTSRTFNSVTVLRLVSNICPLAIR